MKTFCLFILVFLFISCASTQFFSRTWEDENTGQQMVSDTIVYVHPLGLFTFCAKSKFVKYRLKWGNLLCGAVFAPTYIIPAVMWGFFLFQADRIEGDKYEYVKVNPETL
jgi:hypothetical protein